MRKLLATLILISGCISLLAACATDTRYYAVRDHKPLVSTLGFSITPPPGDNWYESHQNDSLLFRKLGKYKTYSLTTKATELVLNKKFDRQRDFMNYVKEIKALHLNKKQLSNASTMFSWADSTDSQYCVRYQQDYEDHGLRNLGKNDYVMVKNIGLICMHPETPEVGIDISYLEKSIASAHPPSYKDEGEKFLGSLMFFHKKN
jgi:hypothetical protein